jgi:hypothetical protein
VPGNLCGEVAWNCPELKQRKRDCGQTQKIATGKFHRDEPPVLGTDPQPQKGLPYQRRLKFGLLGPAEGTITLFDSAERRLMPLTAPGGFA